MKTRTNEEVKMMIEHLKYNKCEGCHNTVQGHSPKFQEHNLNFITTTKQGGANIQMNHPSDHISNEDLVNYLRESQTNEFNNYNAKQDHLNDRNYSSTNKLNEMLILANLFFFKGTDLSVDLKLLEEELNALRNLTEQQAKELEIKKELEEDIKRLSFNLTVNEEVVKKSKETISEIEIDRVNLKNIILDHENNEKLMTESINRLIKRITDLEDEVKNKKELEKELQTSRDLITEFEKNKIIAEEHMKTINMFIENSKTEIFELKNTIQEKENNLNENEKALDNLKELTTEYNYNLLNQENQISRSNDLVDTYRFFLQENSLKLVEIEKLNDTLKEKNDVINDKEIIIGRQDEEIKTKESTIESKENEIKNFKKINSKLQEEIRIEKINTENKETEIKIKNKLVDTLEEDIKHYDKSIAEKDTLIKSFEDTLRKTHEQEENQKTLFSEKMKIWGEEKEDLLGERNLIKNENGILKNNIKALEEKINIINDKVEVLLNENKIYEEEAKVNEQLLKANNECFKNLVGGKLDYEQNNVTNLNDTNNCNISPKITAKLSIIKPSPNTNKLSPVRYKSMALPNENNKLSDSVNNYNMSQVFKGSDSLFFSKDNMSVKKDSYKQLNNSVTRDNENPAIKKMSTIASPSSTNVPNQQSLNSSKRISCEESNKIITFENIVNSEYNWQNGNKKFSNSSDKFETMSLKNSIKGNWKVTLKIIQMTHGIHLGVSANKIELSDLKNRAFLGKYASEYAYNLFSGYFWKNDKKYKKLEKTLKSGDFIEMSYDNGNLIFVFGGESFIAFKNVPDNTFPAATIMNKEDSLEIIKVEMF